MFLKSCINPVIGFMSLLACHRTALMDDIKSVRDYQPTHTKHIQTVKDLIAVDNSIITTVYREQIEKQCKGFMDEFTISLEEDTFAEETLVKAHLRRLRNLYIVLMEVCKRDEKLLPW
jgi:hypothetical protein